MGLPFRACVSDSSSSPRNASSEPHSKKDFAALTKPSCLSFSLGNITKTIVFENWRKNFCLFQVFRNYLSLIAQLFTI